MNPDTAGRSSLSSSGFSLDSILYTISKQTLCLSSSLKREGGGWWKKNSYIAFLFTATQRTRRSVEVLAIISGFA